LDVLKYEKIKNSVLFCRLKILNFGLLIYTCNTDKFVHLWDVHIGKEVGILDNDTLGLKSIIKIDNERIITAGPLSPMKLWNVKSLIYILFTLKEI